MENDPPLPLATDSAEDPTSKEKTISLDDNDVEDSRTYAQKAKANGMLYTVTDVPPLVLSIFLGIQHYLTMLGANVLVPLLVTPAMGATLEQTS
jgi:hypothetical protein